MAIALGFNPVRVRLWIVAAREEERRRLRRDLYDGLGPALTGIAFGADAAREIAGAAPGVAVLMLTVRRRLGVRGHGGPSGPFPALKP